MRRYYEEPEVNIRRYQYASEVFTDPSFPEGDNHDLGDDDEYDIFG